ncbi:MAG: SAM-dependent methyltransferase [Candidatus Kerfeldbacteria bacterium CG_4_10_14_0_8_um_filter_42_10]|uniref:SAM-dependent methyltransferase n=1 Tax=Candidatus Kerfeldbacteria bacterium CG_4_10_14_0_8_um_filter_42_10 TaxID=2014248 RepID=A0A2M7RLB5_9BACT|nr:MAG: SAM-dependent methyltransferase [Candidatus Kerfeldbacteria bacterium CG_4_10_14_0_8_um_filter_42_10]
MRYIKKAFRLLIKTAERFFYRGGNKRKCYVCQRTFRRFTKYRGGFTKTSRLVKMLVMVGSGRRRDFGCVYCTSYDRERHLFMYFDKLAVWNKMKNARILHFAPERNLAVKISEQKPLEYVKADFNPRQESIKKVNITQIPYNDETFDFVICNHVLEHVPDYLKALREIHRVLRKNGTAILQSPYSKLIDYHFEIKNITTNAQRAYLYGQEDHVRIFSEKHYFNDLQKIGFILRVFKNDQFFSAEESYYYGINEKEDLVMVSKPAN